MRRRWKAWRCSCPVPPVAGTGDRERPGLLTGAFLIGYGVFRSFVELFREPDAHLGFLLRA